MTRSNLYRKFPGRVLEWWSFLVPFLLGAGYISAFYFHAPFIETLSISGLFLISIAATAGFGYMLNDYTDVREDKLSGKRNVVAQLGMAKSALLLVVFLVFAVAPWYFLPHSVLNLSVYASQLLLLVVYSVPPLRFKKYAIPGIINDSFYNSVVPVFIMITTFMVLAGAKISDYIFQMVVVFTWAFFKGLRNILLHQLQDRKNDQKSGLITFVVRYGPITSTNILNRWILPLEIGVFTIMVLILSLFMPLFWVIYILFLIYVLLKIRIWSIGWASKREFRRMFHFVLNDFYEEWIPISALIYLSISDPLFLILLVLHLLLFPRNIIKNIRDIKEINRDFNKYYQRSFWPQVGVWLAPVFAAINRFFKYISRKLRLFFDYLLNTPVRAKNSFIYINRRYFGGQLSLVKEMIMGKIRRIRNRVKYTVTKPGIKGTKLDRAELHAIHMYNKQRMTGPRPSICLAPFSNLFIDSNSRVAACRYNTLSLNDEGDIRAAWNGDALKKLRDHLKRNNLSQGCDLCRDHIKNKMFEAVGANQYDALKYQQAFPVSLEFSLQNSTGDIPNWIDFNIPHLKTAHFMGSEPFLNDFYFKIWERIISINRGCIIDIITNGDVLNDRMKEILGKGLFRIRISATGLFPGKSEDSDRKTDSEKIRDNIRYFAQNSRRENIPIHLVYKPDRKNLNFLPQTIELCNELQAYADIDLSEMERASSFRLMSDTETESACDFLRSHYPKGKGLIAKINRRMYQSFINFMLRKS